MRRLRTAIAKRLAGERWIPFGQAERMKLELKDQKKQIWTLEKVAAEAFGLTGEPALLPPPELRTHVGRVATAANFWGQGLSSSSRVLEVFGDEPDGLVLDWGCGSGRTLNWLCRRPGWRDNYRGCDVDAEAIGWLHDQGVGQVAVCGEAPPLPYPDNHFAGLFCFSVLTHIPPQAHAAWYQDIRRILKTGGRAYLTVQSGAMLDFGKDFTAEERAFYDQNGWLWSEREGHYKHSAPVSEAFTRRALEPLFEIESYTPAGYHQMDAITVRKP
ncbi:MAG: class I SAM-dependent methyltransferase [Caulobacteraceae bacterium]